MSDTILRRIVMTLILAGLVLPPLLAGRFLDLTPSLTQEATPITLTLAEQVIIVIAGFVLKPLYQIISLVVFIMLWRKTDSDLVALRRAMLAFVIGENACALNYILFSERSLLLEFLHTYGMLICFGLVSYAAMEAFDKRVFNFSNPERKCVLLPLCRCCYKYSNAGCNLRVLFLFVIPATAILASMPLAAPIEERLYVGNVFGNNAIFGHSVALQTIEIHYYPVVSLVLLGASFLILFFYGESGFEKSKVFYSMGIGPLGFSLMRFSLYWGYKENPLWADAWEEITEFIFIAFVFLIVIRIRSAVKRSCTSKMGLT